MALGRLSTAPGAGLAGVVALLLLLWGVLPAKAAEREMQKRITVAASGTVTAVPDIALISAGVVSEAETARAALEANTAAMRRLIEGLKAAGIEAGDIQTASFDVHPVYSTDTSNAPSPRPQRPTIVAYRVQNQVRITARNIDRLGEVLDRAVTLGANQVGRIEFRVSQAEKLRDDARREAIANARRRAELFASAAGVKLGRVLQIEEVGEEGPRPMPRLMKAEAVPIERGTETLEATVRVTWELE